MSPVLERSLRRQRVGGSPIRAALCFLSGIVLLAACRVPGSVQRTVKIGLSAPFEGRYRDVGYEALHAVRLAVRERNEAGGVGSRYYVELVALNDLNEPAEALQKAREMAVDEDIMGVLGGLSIETARAAAPEYERLGLAFLASPGEWSGGQAPWGGDPERTSRYLELSGGAPPGPIAAWAYVQALFLLDALDAASLDTGRPTRPAVQKLVRARETG
jgi:hypothetical protein